MANVCVPLGCVNEVAQLTAALQTGGGRAAVPSKVFSTSLMALSSGVPLMTMPLPDPVIGSYANAVSAMTRNRKGSAFCLYREAACLVLASMIFEHQSCRACLDGACSSTVSLWPRCLILNGYMTSFGLSRLVAGMSVLPEPVVLVEAVDDDVSVCMRGGPI